MISSSEHYHCKNEQISIDYQIVAPILDHTEPAKEDMQVAYDHYDQSIIRDVKVDRFPYVIIFEVTKDKVLVYSVHNTYQHPKRRLRKV